MPGKRCGNALVARDRELDDLDILDEVDVDRDLLSLWREEPSFAQMSSEESICESVSSARFGPPRAAPQARRTHAVGLEDGKDSFLGDELRELDVLLVLLVLLLVVVVLVLIVRLELGVLHGDDRASISLDLCAVLHSRRRVS